MKPVATISIVLSLMCLMGCLDRRPIDAPKDPEELRRELRMLEELSPLEYISGEEVQLDPQRIQTRSAGFFHDAEYAPAGAIISGSFRNTACLARYKDVQIKLKFFSATKTLIGEETYTIYKYVEPNSSTPFSFRINEVPEAMENFDSEIVGATPVGE